MSRTFSGAVGGEVWPCSADAQGKLIAGLGSTFLVLAQGWGQVQGPVGMTEA